MFPGIEHSKLFCFFPFSGAFSSFHFHLLAFCGYRIVGGGLFFSSFILMFVLILYALWHFAFANPLNELAIYEKIYFIFFSVQVLKLIKLTYWSIVYLGPRMQLDSEETETMITFDCSDLLPDEVLQNYKSFLVPSTGSLS